MNDAQVEKYWNAVQVSVGEMAIRQVFNTFPRMDRLSDLLIKGATLNGLASAGNRWLEQTANHYLRISNLTVRLDTHDLGVIDEMANVSVRRAGQVNRRGGILPEIQNMLSFASKMAAYYSPESYCIYDKIVANSLLEHRHEYGYGEYSTDNYRALLRNYRVFSEIISNLSVYWGLRHPWSARHIECAIWYGIKHKMPVW